MAGAIGFQGGLWESAIVRFHPSGKVHVFIGASPHGQGEETTFAQIIGSELGVDPQDVKVFHGDTDEVPRGGITGGSRSAQKAGSAVAVATETLGEIVSRGKLLSRQGEELADFQQTYRLWRGSRVLLIDIELIDLVLS